MRAAGAACVVAVASSVPAVLRSAMGWSVVSLASVGACGLCSAVERCSADRVCARPGSGGETCSGAGSVTGSVSVSGSGAVTVSGAGCISSSSSSNISSSSSSSSSSRSGSAPGPTGCPVTVSSSSGSGANPGVCHAGAGSAAVVGCAAGATSSGVPETRRRASIEDVPHAGPSSTTTRRRGVDGSLDQSGSTPQRLGPLGLKGRGDDAGMPLSGIETRSGLSSAGVVSPSEVMQQA